MLLHSIELTDILSFRQARLDLRPLNVLIGANASGKSNLISAIGLLKSAPDNLQSVMWSGGIRSWICQLPGARKAAQIRCEIEVGGETIEYSLSLGERGTGFVVVGESLKDQGSGSVIFERAGDRVKRTKSGSSGLKEAQVGDTTSFLASFRDPSDETPITMTAERIATIRTFRGFNTTTNSPVRNGVSISIPKDFLLETGDNLALVLQNLDFRGELATVNQFLQRLWERAEAVRINIEGQIAQTYIKERDIQYPISAARLSDGTLKFLCLMAALLFPDPPPLVCIEEPELGLHPDAMAIVADALRLASQRTQLIVTTHSDALVSALSDDPEAIVVCERDEQGGSEFRRLSSADLSEWLERYSLGELWRKGEIGGNRW